MKKLNILDYLSPKGFNEVQWYACFIAMLAVLLIGWTSVMSLLGLNVSLSNIAYLHRYVFVWLFDLFVIVILLFYLYIVNFKKKNIDNLNEEIDELKSEISNAVVLAGKIGGVSVSQNSKLDDTLKKVGENFSNAKSVEEQRNWVARGKEAISDILRKHNKIEDLAIESLESLVKYFDAAQGAFFILEGEDLRTITQYAYGRRRFETVHATLGRGLVGACAYERQMIYRTSIPDDYFTITSGLMGLSKPQTILLIPLLQEQEVQGVIELSFVKKGLTQQFFDLATELSVVIGSTIYNLKINEQTARLLRESQEMTEILKKNQEELQEKALELQEKSDEVTKSNAELQEKMQEVENGQKLLQALLTNASEFMSIYNEKRELTFESPSVKRILGYDPEDKNVRGMDEEVMTPVGWRKLQSMFDFLLATPGGETSLQYTYLKKSGEKIYLVTQGKNLLHDPAIRGLVFNTRDVTARIRAEREERMKSRMQSLSENSPDMIIRINTNGVVEYSNPGAAAFLEEALPDFSNKEKKDRKLQKFNSELNFVKFMMESKEALKRTKEKMESELDILANGEKRTFEVRAIPEFNENDNTMESILYVAHDVTELKRIEEEIKEKNQKLSDSINYALRIQRAILPEEKHFQEFLPDMFMFYRPKDVVSGDFPWCYNFGNIHYLAAVDCTGHGVPGALLSFIGYFLLNNIVEMDHNLPADEVLTRLHEGVRDTLRQREGANGRDGMDLALCRIDLDKHELQFAAAHRPMYYYRNGEFTEYKGTSKGIGGAPITDSKGNIRPEPEFKNNVIQYEKGDRFFIFSDGMPDQLGGEDGKKKFQTKRIREIIDRTHSESMVGVANEVSKGFYEWKDQANAKQVDDVLFFGIELP